MSEIGQAVRDKVEIIKQWNNDPCGISSARELEPGSREFYERIDENRYHEYAPWMRSVMGFDRFAGKRLLEVGFGMGTDLFQFARHGAIASGIDLTPRHLEIASRRFDLYGMPVDLRLGDAEDLPYEDQTFDVVYSFGVIHHTPDAQRAVDEIYRVLRPGGTAIIGVYHKWSLFFLLSTILWSYILRARFLRESLRRTMSRIEYRQNSEACPLVKVYSRREMARMMRTFTSIQFEIRHLGRQEFGVLSRLGLVPSWLTDRVERFMGWYLIAKSVR